MLPAPWMNGVAFTIAAAAVWWSGRALAARADLIADRTAIGSLLAGALLLGVATSLPEFATTVAAAGTGATALAGNNLLGGVAMQIAVLAVVDMVALRGRALTAFTPNAGLLLQGVFLILLLAAAAAAISVPGPAIAGWVSPWSIALAAAYGATLYYLHRYQGEPRWEPRGEVLEPPQSAVDMKDAVAARFAARSTRRVGWEFAGFTAVVLVGGYGVAVTGDAIAEQSGLGESVVGASLVAAATSLPELSTTFAAVRCGAYSMAVGNILGTNALELALFLPADLVSVSGPLFPDLGRSSLLLAMIAIAVTGIYLWGMLERRDRTILGLGIDSALVLVVYALGMAVFAAAG